MSNIYVQSVLLSSIIGSTIPENAETSYINPPSRPGLADMIFPEMQSRIGEFAPTGVELDQAKTSVIADSLNAMAKTAAETRKQIEQSGWAVLTNAKNAGQITDAERLAIWQALFPSETSTPGSTFYEIVEKEAMEKAICSEIPRPTLADDILLQMKSRINEIAVPNLPLVEEMLQQMAAAATSTNKDIEQSGWAVLTNAKNAGQIMDAERLAIWQALFPSETSTPGSTFYEIVEKDIMLRLVAPQPRVEGTALSLAPGETKILTITGTNLPPLVTLSEPVVVGATADKLTVRIISSLPAETNLPLQSLTLEVTSAKDAEQGLYAITFSNKQYPCLNLYVENAINVQSSISPMQKAAYLFQKQLQMELNIGAGYTGEVGRAESKAPEASRANLANITEPNFSAELKLRPKVFGPEDAFLPNNTVSLEPNGHLNYNTSSIFEAGIGLGSTLIALPYVMPEIYGNYDYAKTNYHRTNRRYVNGQNNSYLGGLALSHRFNINILPVSIREFGEYQLDRFSYEHDELVSFVDFSGQDQFIKTGGQLDLGFTMLGSSAWIPNLSLSGSGLWGTTEVPEVMPGLQESSFENVTGMEANTTIAFKNNSLAPSLSFNYEEYYRQGWNDVSAYELNGSLTSFNAGRFELATGEKWHVAPFYGDNEPFFLDFSYTLPEFKGNSYLWSGRLSAISIRARWDQFEDPAGRQYSQLGGSIFFNLLKLITGTDQGR